MTSTSLAEQVVGRTVGIVGHVGGGIQYTPSGTIKTAPYDPLSLFVVESSPVESNEPMVTFRFDGTALYLTQNPYGDTARSESLQALIDVERVQPLPAEVLSSIIEFAVPTGTQTGNFEGEGFDYSPMTVMAGPPGMLQSFALEGERLDSVGIRSPFRKYWRSQHWNHTVSQSSHCLRDETWRFDRVPLVVGRQPSVKQRQSNKRRQRRKQC